MKERHIQINSKLLSSHLFWKIQSLRTFPDALNLSHMKERQCWHIFVPIFVPSMWQASQFVDDFFLSQIFIPHKVHYIWATGNCNALLYIISNWVLDRWINVDPFLSVWNVSSNSKFPCFDSHNKGWNCHTLSSVWHLGVATFWRPGSKMSGCPNWDLTLFPEVIAANSFSFHFPCGHFSMKAFLQLAIMCVTPCKRRHILTTRVNRLRLR